MKRFKKLINIVVITSLICNIGVNAGALTNTSIVNENDLDVVSIIELNQIEAINSEISGLNLEYNEENSLTKKNNLLSEINDKREEMFSLGAEIPSDELLEELIISSMGENPSSKLRANWNPSEIVDQYKHMYDIIGTNVSYAGKKQYHLTFSPKPTVFSSYLSRGNQAVLYDKFSANSSEATKWVNEIVNIYADKLTSSAIETILPIMKFLPYELISSIKPSPSSIYTGATEALKGEANTTSIIKFVYIYSDVSKNWIYSLSTSKIAWTAIVWQSIYVNGGMCTNKKTFDWQNINGSFNNAASDADIAYGLSTNYNTCINSFKFFSTQKNSNSIYISLHTPNYVIGMM